MVTFGGHTATLTGGLDFQHGVSYLCSIVRTHLFCRRSIWDRRTDRRIAASFNAITSLPYLQWPSYIQSGPEKNAQSLLHHDFAIVGKKSRGLHQNVHKLSGNTKGTEFKYRHILCMAAGKWITQKMSILATFSTLSWRKKSLQQVNITKLTKTVLNVSIMRMNDQQQSFRPLVNSSID